MTFRAVQELNGQDSFGPLQMPKAAAMAAAAVRRRIVRGELKADDALPPESELMKQFGISRPTLREALRILESEGLIFVRRGAHGGARVKAPSPETAIEYVSLLLEFDQTSIEDVLKAQAVLEVGAVRELATKVPIGAIARLEEIVAEEGDALGDIDRFNAATARFHTRLPELSGSKTIALMGHMLSKIIIKHGLVVASVQRRERSTSKIPAWQRKSHEVHKQVIELIKQMDAKQAADLWAAHLRANQKATLADTPKNTVLDLFD
jgi:DNA-binding FadR family transcriptional regulator